MPRPIDKDLLDCLERANPYTEYRTEISEPDTGQVLRRVDQFTQAPSLVSMTPAASLAASARGALILAPTTGALQSFAGVGSSFDLNGESIQRRLKGVAWTMDYAFSRATLKSIQAKIERVALAGFFFDADIECQVYRITKTPGVKQLNVGTAQYQSIAWTEYTFTPLLSPAPTLKASAQAWDGANRATLNFDLTNWNLTLENSPARAITPDQVGELPEYHIVIRLAGKPPAGTGHFKWLVDNVSARTIANKGTFERVWWVRDNDQTPWARTVFADVPNVTINIETYPATGQAVYLIDQGKVPGALSSGRVDFQRSVPPGTSATAEISTAGTGGPWTAVKHGDVVATKQQTYHLRLTLNADAALRATPQINSAGVEFRIPRDVSVEGVPDLPSREIELPWPKASIPEGRIRVVRTGVRDFLDVATALGSTAATPRLEADIYLASRHPSITRDKWHRLERMMVTSRRPSATSEEFTLLSRASRLKRKIPQKVESLNSVHTVQAGSTAAQIIVSPALPGTTVSGNEYDGKLYYIRVRSTAAPNTKPGFLATIQGNTSTDRLDFSPALTEALVAGDIIEVHSGVFQTAAVSWIDADPADVWDGVMTLLSIPPEWIGLGWLPRGGRPPKVTDIAPGDATTQAKRKITVRLSDQESGDEILDQISTILGGVTLEIDGQLVYVQIIPLVDLNGTVTVPLPPPSAVFDARDISSLSTPPGLEKRATIVSCNYGVPATAAAPDAFPSKSTTSVDGDALLWLAQQDLEDYGTAQVPDNIARWLYNSTDAGLYLASVVATQLVKCASTGLRVFAIGMAEKQPRLAPGDVIIIATDQYTDYDPSTQTPLAGPMAIRGVLVGVGAEGRRLSMFVTGLIDNVQLVKGGASGVLSGLGVIPAPPVLSASFDVSGQLIINSSGDFATSSQKIAWATGAPPSAATVRAAAPIAQQLVSGLATGSLYPAGTTVFIAAFAYNANGVESTPIAVVSVTRQGSGTSAPPVGFITPLNGESDDLIWNERFDAIAGSGGGGANLTWFIKQKIGFAAETTLFSGNATTLPKDAAIARHPRSDKNIRFRVTDTATGLFSEVNLVMPAARPEVNDTGNPFRGRAYDDGDYTVRGTTASGDTAHSGVKESTGKEIRRQFAKPLHTSPDDADSVLAGLQRRIPLLGATDSTGNIDLAGTAWINKHAGNVAQRSPSQGGTWSASGVTLSGAASLINDGDLITNAFHTDTAVAGAYVQVDMGAATTFDMLRCYIDALSNAVWKLRHSPDGAVWTDALTGIQFINAGWNVVSFTAATKRYWRLELTNTPGGGPWTKEVELVWEVGGTVVAHQRPIPTVRYEDGVTRSVTAIENSGHLNASTQQKNGTGLKNIANGRYSLGTGVHAQSITFPTNYQNPPAVNILGGISYEPASVWGTPGQADAGGTGTTAPNAARQIDEVVAYNVTASGASLRARLRQASATTARTDAYAAGAITGNGGTKEATTANAPAANDTYTTDFTAQFTSTAIPGKSCSVSGTVCLDYWNGSVWTQVASATYSASDPVGGNADTGLISDTLVATVSGLTGSSKFRIRLVTNAGSGSRTYSVDPGNVAYTTTTGDLYATKTPSGLGIDLSVEVIGAS